MIEVSGICLLVVKLMDVKCSFVGVVDVISVEDIGDFFDINLVELL